MFSKILNWIDSTFFLKEDDEIYNYLAKSSDLVDLERRQRLIERGQAPFQVAKRIFVKNNYISH